MKNSVAVILPKNFHLEEEYDNVISQDDLIEFEYTVEKSIEFKSAYAPFLKSYVEWFYYSGKKTKQKIESLLGFTPKEDACRSFFKNLSPVYTIKTQDYRRKIEGRFPKFYLPSSFIHDVNYYESAYNSLLLSSCSTTELEMKNKKPVGKLKKRLEEDYKEILFTILNENPDRLVVVCTKT